MGDEQIVKALRQRGVLVARKAFSSSGASKTVTAEFVRHNLKQILSESKKDQEGFVRNLWPNVADDEQDRLLQIAFPDGDYSEEMLNAEATP